MHTRELTLPLQEPVSRNWYYAGFTGYTNNFYCEHCLNRNVLPFAAGICGGQARTQCRLLGSE